MTKVRQDAFNTTICTKSVDVLAREKTKGAKLKAKKNSPVPPHLICTCPQLPALYTWQRLLLGLNEPFTGAYTMCPRYVQTAPLSRERFSLLNVSKLGKICYGCIKAFRKKDCLRLDSITISCTQEAKCRSLKRFHARLKTKHFFVQQRCLNSRDFTIPRRDGNENTKNNNRFSRQNHNFARASHCFVHFFAVFARLQREIA